MAATAGYVSLSAFPHHLFAADQAKLPSDCVALGKTGLTVTRLALGTGTNGSSGSSDQTRGLGVSGLAVMLRQGFDHGVTFWDSADQYGSHPHLKAALQDGVPRDKVTILTKTHAKTEAEMRADLDRFRRELGTDYLDICLLHCMINPKWNEECKGAMAVLSEAKEKGIVKANGVSCHSFGALKTAAAEDWVDVDLARVNPAGAVMDASPGEVVAVLKEMKAKGKGIIGMKILGAGQLKGKADECFQWALAQDCVDCFTLGMQNPAQLESTLKQIPAASVRG